MAAKKQTLEEKVERGTKYATYLIEHDVSLRECGDFFKVSKTTIATYIELLKDVKGKKMLYKKAKKLMIARRSRNK